MNIDLIMSMVSLPTEVERITNKVLYGGIDAIEKLGSNSFEQHFDDNFASVPDLLQSVSSLNHILVNQLHSIHSFKAEVHVRPFPGDLNEVLMAQGCYSHKEGLDADIEFANFGEDAISPPLDEHQSGDVETVTGYTFSENRIGVSKEHFAHGEC